MFQFTGFPSVYYLFHIQIHGSSPCGFPHSDIRGSLDICSSPRLFAAYHVFLRLLVPRHPPCALLCLTFLFFHDCIALQPCSLFSFFASASFSLLSQLSASASHCLSLLSFDVSFSSLNIRFSRYMQYFIWLFYQSWKTKISFLSFMAGKTSSLDLIIYTYLYKELLLSLFFYSGSHLLSHTVSSAVPSAA